ncbi:MAG: YdeI/OmpD-associated family protein [Christensenellaceae bacterium]|nr:YdeI/OmpD-associated family protein [Christensenellaceae bacterium]
MDEPLLFPARSDFRAWLTEHPDESGVWLLFGKRGGPKTLTAAQALEEALCFGWIDGLMESIDETCYRKYFATRRPQSKWSEKNRKLAEKLEAEGLMTDRGRRAIEEAKRRGLYENGPRMQSDGDQVEAMRALLAPHETALRNFDAMTPSVRRTYTTSYFSLKTEAGREKRLAQLVERLELNLNPMESLAKRKAESGES